jgi:uncharacterized membrane protein YdbT with pleckstrin-like domain
MNDALRRAIRTFLQAFIGTLMLIAVPALNDIVRAIINAEPYKIDFAFWQGVGLAATLSGFVAFITFVWNELEQSTGKDVLKNESPQHPAGPTV